MTETTWARPAVRRRTWTGLLAAVAAATLVLAPGVGAAPALVSPVPDAATPSVNGRVEAIASGDGWIYIGGSFTSVGGRARAGLARVNASTLEVDRNWQADVAGRVAALAVNGGTLYVGGEFTSVGGVTRENLAAVSTAVPASVDLDWNPAPNRSVEALAASGGDLYVGGKFERIAGTSRPKLAKLSAATGEVVGAFAPSPNQWVAALVLGGGRLYAGGFFTAIGGTSQRYLAALDPGSGAGDAAWRPSLSCPVYGLDLATDLYVACGGSGGSGLAFATGTSATRRWQVRTNGNVHAVAHLGGAVYLGGHFTTMGGAARKKGGAVDAADGTLLTGWNPGFNSTFGVFTMLADNGALWAGGDFTRVGSTRKLRLARFSPS